MASKTYFQRNRRRKIKGNNAQPFFQKAGGEVTEATEQSTFFAPKIDPIQAKFTVNQPGDVYEQEADAMAEKVVKQPAAATPSVQRMSGKKEEEIHKMSEPHKEEEIQKVSDTPKEEDKQLHRKPEAHKEEEIQKMATTPKEEDKQLQREPEAHKDEEIQKKPTQKEEDQSIHRMSSPHKEEDIHKKADHEEKKEIQTKATNGSGSGVNPAVAQSIQNSKGGGSSLPKQTEKEMSQAFGYDFSSVRVHTDSESEHLNQELQAQAFTTGKDIYFNEGKYNPENQEGKKLLAHELTHVVQQGGADLKKQDAEHSPSASTSAENNTLTQAQIRSAIWYNRIRYNKTNTSLIQKILGLAETGVWNEELILTIVDFQRSNALDDDGMIGKNTYQALDTAMGDAGFADTNSEVLIMFLTPSGNVVPRRINFAAGIPGIEGHFSILAQFPSRIGCNQWEYRQFIKGSAQVSRGSTVVNVNHYFTTLPAGRLLTSWQEDGNTNWAGINYGHRNQPGRGFNPINRYEKPDNTPDQQNGCIYKGEDSPHFSEPAAIAGDVLTLNLTFNGQIIRNSPVNGREIVQSRSWTVRGSITI